MHRLLDLLLVIFIVTTPVRHL